MLISRFRQPRPAALPPLRRIYAVGDVHGRLDLLQQLYATIALDDAKRDPANTEIILLGDLIDRGPDSAGVVHFAMRTRPAFANLVTLKGNHESVFLKALAGDDDMMVSWLGFGGRETLESWNVAQDLLDEADPATVRQAALAALSEAERCWLASLPMSLKIGDYLFVHAGIRPGVPLAEQSESDLIWIREGFLDNHDDLGVTVVHGHTIVRRPGFARSRIAIDTGAFHTGRLTALGLEGTKRWLLST